MAIRYFAGGAPPDIALVHGVGLSDVYKSVWMVVDAVHKCPDLAINFPVNHDDQKHIADEFMAISKAGFDNCVGAIDGMLIWIHMPTKAQAGEVGGGKYYCGRKKKYGLSMQAVCDARKRFIDVDIRNPGSMSDYLMFLRSSLHDKLEEDGFLKEGLVLYGDNAYVNTSYMATPFKSAKRSEDDYNYYQSGVRINIECAFGILVNRWGILRSIMPQGIDIDKTTALVYCLCKLHNFCIDQTEADKLDNNPDDALQIANNGEVPFDDVNGNPNQLLHGGHHFEDAPYEQRRCRDLNIELPRDKMLKTVVDKALRRPTPIPR
jgi:DDE superfamily endonuclease